MKIVLPQKPTSGLKLDPHLLDAELRAAAAEAEERRAVSRQACAARARWRRAGSSEEPALAGIRDISSLGIGLETHAAIEPNAMLELELVNKDDIRVRNVMARVIHSEQEGEVWLVGCAFVGELGDADLRLFRALKVRPNSPDSRRWVRFPCNVETICYTCETAPGERRPACILNVSAGGVGLLLPCEFSTGTLLQFELPAEAARLALIRVIRVVEHPPRGWFHGCEFVDPVGADELKELLGQ